MSAVVIRLSTSLESIFTGNEIIITPAGMYRQCYLLTKIFEFAVIISIDPFHIKLGWISFGHLNSLGKLTKGENETLKRE